METSHALSPREKMVAALSKCFTHAWKLPMPCVQGRRLLPLYLSVLHMHGSFPCPEGQVGKWAGTELLFRVPFVGQCSRFYSGYVRSVPSSPPPDLPPTHPQHTLTHTSLYLHTPPLCFSLSVSLHCPLPLPPPLSLSITSLFCPPFFTPSLSLPTPPLSLSVVDKEK